MTAVKGNDDTKVLIVSAPSGAGKSTLVKHLLDSGMPFSFSVSATSRRPRGREKNGVEYYFLTAEEFRQKIKAGEFIEWEEVYEDHFYGTLRSEIDRIRNEGRIPLFDVDVRGGISLKKIFGDNALALFIMPPSVEELRQRLVRRGTDTPDKIDMRIEKASSEITLADRFDRIIVNDDLARACREITTLVTEFLK